MATASAVQHFGIQLSLLGHSNNQFRTDGITGKRYPFQDKKSSCGHRISSCTLCCGRDGVLPFACRRHKRNTNMLWHDIAKGAPYDYRVGEGFRNRSVVEKKNQRMRGAVDTLLCGGARILCSCSVRINVPYRAHVQHMSTQKCTRRIVEHLLL